MRPLSRAPPISRTTILPTRNRASATVSAGSSARRRRRREMAFSMDFTVAARQSSGAATKSNPTAGSGRIPTPERPSRAEARRADPNGLPVTPSGNPRETDPSGYRRSFLDLASPRLNNEESMSVRAGGAVDMFLDVKDLAVRKLSIRKSYAPGSIDFQTAEIKQVEPLEVTATAELLDGQIRVAGEI